RGTTPGVVRPTHGCRQALNQNPLPEAVFCSSDGTIAFFRLGTKGAMPRRLLSLPLLIMFAMSPLRVWATSECAHLVAIGAGEVPYQWSEGRPQGAHVGLLNRVAAELGVTVEFLVADSRQQAEAEADSGRVDLLVGTERRPELVGLDFLLPPLYQTPLVAWVPGERAF